jgi:hypothetical protein
MPRGQQNHALVAYRLGHGIVISHDCAIDKPNNNNRVPYAPVASLETLDPVTQEAVRRQAHLAAMLLPEIPGIGDAYAELRLISPFPFELVSGLRRIASLTDAARARLHGAIVAFFVLRELPVPPLLTNR